MVNSPESCMCHVNKAHITSTSLKFTENFYRIATLHIQIIKCYIRIADIFISWCNGESKKGWITPRHCIVACKPVIIGIDFTA